jgi:hypothetical protein
MLAHCQIQTIFVFQNFKKQLNPGDGIVFMLFSLMTCIGSVRESYIYGDLEWATTTTLHQFKFDLLPPLSVTHG